MSIALTSGTRWQGPVSLPAGAGASQSGRCEATRPKHSATPALQSYAVGGLFGCTCVHEAIKLASVSCRPGESSVSPSSDRVQASPGETARESSEARAGPDEEPSFLSRRSPLESSRLGTNTRPPLVHDSNPGPRCLMQGRVFSAAGARVADAPPPRSAALTTATLRPAMLGVCPSPRSSRPMASPGSGPHRGRPTASTGCVGCRPASSR
jgi:hypothetical protein